VIAKEKQDWRQSKTRGVSQCRLAIYIKKYLKAKRRSMKIQIFHHAKIQSSKKSSQRNQNPSRYYNSIITNLKFQHKPKYHLSKSSYKNRPTTFRASELALSTTPI
jgi:hypothetical protein